MAALDDYRGQFPELQGLEQEVIRLESLLMQRQGLTRSRASSLSITVEHALESFSFLNEDEDEDNDGPGDRPPSSLEPKAEDGLNSPSARPLSTECPALDTALVQHLYYCSRLLLVRLVASPLHSFYLRELSTPALSSIPNAPGPWHLALTEHLPHSGSL